MDISGKFSLEDFLAYLFPGIIGTLGLYLLLLLTPLNPLLVSMPMDLATGILVLALSYVIGIILSGFAEIVVDFARRRNPEKWAKNTIPVPKFEDRIKTAFDVVFGQKERTEWSASHFFLCRSMIIEFMPGLAPRIGRQGGLRQLRMNLVPALTIWLIVGIAWGIASIPNTPAWGYALLTGSVVVWFLVVWTIVKRMKRNEIREVREVLTGFLAGYEKGLFEEQDSTSQ